MNTTLCPFRRRRMRARSRPVPLSSAIQYPVCDERLCNATRRFSGCTVLYFRLCEVGLFLTTSGYHCIPFWKYYIVRSSSTIQEFQVTTSTKGRLLVPTMDAHGSALTILPSLCLKIPPQITLASLLCRLSFVLVALARRNVNPFSLKR